MHGISGPFDLLIHVVAVDADDLYRIAGRSWPSPASSAPTPRWPCANSSTIGSLRYCVV